MDDGPDVDHQKDQEVPHQLARQLRTNLKPTTGGVDSVEAGHSPSQPSQVKIKDLPTTADQPLPEKSGWVKKITANWLIGWQWRWLVLKDRRLCWFDGPELQKLHGVLDFDLVMTDVERLWAPSGGTGEAQVVERHKDRGVCGMRRGVCAPVSNLLDSTSSQEVRFRLCANGSNRAFEMYAASEEDGNEWVSTLVAHIAEAEKQAANGKMGDRSASRLPTFDRAWWRVSRILPHQFETLAQTGDVLLFRSKGAFPKLLRAVSGRARFDHVGIILKLDTNVVAVLEATGNTGVGVCTWKEFLENEWHKLYPELALRRVRFQRDPERLQRLQEWINEVIGKPYSLTVSQLARRGSTGGGQQEFFCSQLVAEALKVLGVIPRGGKNSAEFWPSSFSTKSSETIEVSPGCSFDPEELTIDFSLEEPQIRSSSATLKQRDVTVKAW